MKCALVLLLLVSLSAVLTHAQTSASNQRTVDQQAIRELNEAALKAYNKGDVDTLDRIEDAEFDLAGDFGEVSKSQQLAEVRQRKQNDSVVNLTIEKQHFRFYGDTALLTEVEKYDDPANPAGFQTTSVWVKKHGAWKIVHLHYSSLGKKP